MAGCLVSMEYHLTGPVMTQSAACATGILAFTDALRLIQRGEVDVAIVGGVEAPLLPMAFSALGNMGALSKRNDDPQHASRPFDALRDGFVFGEGGAVLVIESAEHALKRGAKPVVEVVGGALTADAYHITAPDPSGRGASMAMTKALKDAGVAPDEVDYIVAHGTSTQLNDATETRAIKATFGEHAYKVAVSSPKSMVGHLLGGAGSVAGLAAIGSIRENVVPPTVNYEVPDPECDLDYVPNVSREAKVDTAIINGFGFGGQNAVSVFRRFSVD
jgi:3-oxoacyl-[acyl-carrier-protein] synthase II